MSVFLHLTIAAAASEDLSVRYDWCSSTGRCQGYMHLTTSNGIPHLGSLQRHLAHKLLD